jgi:hypothetical protein
MGNTLAIIVWGRFRQLRPQRCKVEPKGGFCRRKTAAGGLKDDDAPLAPGKRAIQCGIERGKGASTCTSGLTQGAQRDRGG